MNTGLSKRNLWAYPVGSVGRDMAVGMFTGYLLTYVLFTKSLTGAQFASLSVIMMAARVFDAFNDPIMGNIIEATRTRFGKFKPWIAIGCVLSIVVIILSFSNPFQGWTYVAVFGVLYFIYSIVFTMNDIAYWGMVQALARQAQDRNRLTSRTVFFAGVGQFLAGVIVPTFTAGSMVIGGNAITAYRVVAIGVCSLFFVFQLLTVLLVREEIPDQTEAEAVGLGKIFRVIRGNDQLVWGGICFLIFSVGQLLLGNGLSVSYLYFSFGYNGLLLSIFSILGNLAGAVLMVRFAAMSDRYSRNQLMKGGTWMSVAGYLAMLAVGLAVPSSFLAVKFSLLTLSNLFAFLGQTLVYLLWMICIANTVEYNEWKTGRREEGIIFSVRPFMTKLAGAVAQFLVMMIYLVIGVRSVTNGISEWENAASAGKCTIEEKVLQIESLLNGVPEAKTNGLLVCMTILPVLLLLAAYGIYRKRFVITEEFYEKMIKEIAEKQSEGRTE